MSDQVLAGILEQLERLTKQNEVLTAKLPGLSPALGPVDTDPSPSSSSSPPTPTPAPKPHPSTPQSTSKKSDDLYPHRVIITTYPDQTGIKPLPLTWGAPTALQRGPVLCSRLPNNIKLRNSIGAHSGSYATYRALAIALRTLSPTHIPDYSLTQPPVDIPPQPAWSEKGKIVSLDPWGHLAPQVFSELINSGLDIRPSIAVTKAHIKLSEIDDAVRAGRIEVDGKIVRRCRPVEPLTLDQEGEGEGEGKGKGRGMGDPGVELDVSKAAVEPVWFLPGVAARFGITEQLLRRALFEDTGGMYPELITRPDIKVFLPPIGGLTVYIFGPPAYLSDPSKELTLRIHDECNGSDVFGSDICSCKPYLIYAIEECVRTAQRGGVGLVVYFRKEGRALGEVTKYLVYNLRKREGDRAERYFESTESVAGVRDMRFQRLMPDVLHWLGVRKVDNMISMSDMKYEAIISSSIPILHRSDLPQHLVPGDSRVEIDAKIAAGYWSRRCVRWEDLGGVRGRGWEGEGEG
ncbi:hypothetical protein DACRYDRAFT_90842 [Dacryopinax primogenitus]|uniref:GTP cyclohydrolase II n=1 Tax=Dacryopinax primogenitus (strain DJM 731) TaxID=1858805 RepID=M5FPU0_DACPD|nr:uncharacterized protein DACRYDRAFT_90842 [Dacryopinax primogenitus]EJT98775.1 hypothetical protein DACRYDRAFT_90842 [Dacryopinax primogenitus]